MRNSNEWCGEAARDSKAITCVLESVRKQWRRRPEQRLGQLLCNLAGSAAPENPSVWDVEDEQLTQEIDRQLARRRAEEALTDGMKALEASSCAFYVRDPWWPDEFRLLFMPGIRIKEAMHGLVPAHAKRILCAVGEEGDFFTAAAAEPSLRKEATSLPPLNDPRRPLFEGFGQRENVVSCARLTHRVGAETQAALFVNFGTPTVFTAPVRMRIRRLMKELCGLLPEIQQELLLDSSYPQTTLIRILKPVEQLVTLGLEEQGVAHPTEAPLDPHKGGGQTRSKFTRCLSSILEAALQSLEVRPETGLGTIHLFERETGTLRLAACTGRAMDYPLRGQAQSIRKHEGVVSWVALHKRPLLIGNLPESPFGEARVNTVILKDARSELVVPMLAGDVLLGVLNFESIDPNAFSEESARILSYAANQAAIACRLFEEISEKRDLEELNRWLVDLWHKATDRTAFHPSCPFDDLARATCKALKANICDIWKYDPVEARFRKAGSTHPDDQPEDGIRAKGWTEYIRRTSQTVWIENRKDDLAHFIVLYWDAGEAAWKMTPPANAAVPKVLNERFRTRNLECQLGLPILKDKVCIGVAWVKFDRPQTPPRFKTLVRADQFAEEAALFLRSNEEVGSEWFGVAAGMCVPSGRRMQMTERIFQGAGSILDAPSSN